MDNMEDEEEDEKIKQSLKYQIFNNNTSLFAEVELSDKISEEMKLKVIGNKKNNILEIFKPRQDERRELMAKSFQVSDMGMNMRNMNMPIYMQMGNINMMNPMMNNNMMNIGMTNPMMNNNMINPMMNK